MVFIAAGANEFMVMALREMGWKWLHGILGVIFIVGGIWAFVHPIGAFYELAAILGFLLIFKGTMDIIGSVIQREVSDLWWLGLIVGVLELFLGFWASQQYFAPKATLILGVGRVLRALPRDRRDRDGLRASAGAQGTDLRHGWSGTVEGARRVCRCR